MRKIKGKLMNCQMNSVFEDNERFKNLMWLFIFFIFFLNIIDLVGTRHLLSRGHYEANPFIRNILETKENPYVLLTIMKVGFPLLLFPIFFWFSRTDGIDNNLQKKIMFFSCLIVSIIYVVVIVFFILFSMFVMVIF